MNSSNKWYTKQSEMVTVSEYYGKAQSGVKCREINDMAMEDRVDIKYPKTWLNKLDFIDKVHEGGAKSDKEIVKQMISQTEVEMEQTKKGSKDD
tara:strand:- start:4113 stop:4394 length:282 start_codon:yes stop_codon:yes gene_type:complete